MWGGGLREAGCYGGVARHEMNECIRMASAVCDDTL